MKLTAYGSALVCICLACGCRRHTGNWTQESKHLNPSEVTAVELRGVGPTEFTQEESTDRKEIEAWCDAFNHALKYNAYPGGRNWGDGFVVTLAGPNFPPGGGFSMSEGGVWWNSGPYVARALEERRRMPYHTGHSYVPNELERAEVLAAIERLRFDDVSWVRLWFRDTGSKVSVASSFRHVDVRDSKTVQPLLMETHRADVAKILASRAMVGLDYREAVQIFPVDRRARVLTLKIDKDPAFQGWPADFKAEWEKLRAETLKSEMKRPATK